MANVVSNGQSDISLRAAETSQSAVSWASIFAGAATAVSITLILLALGSGLGFAAVSPWPGAGPTATSFAIGTGIWLILTQWLSAGLGGYIAGRLRTRWPAVHTHEVFFRDTAHGLLSWALATIVIATVAMSTTVATISATTSAAGVATDATDTMLRSDRILDGGSAAVRAEIARMLSHKEPPSADDRAYLAKVVARQTGVSEAQARDRVNAAVTDIREAADTARKAASALSFFTALSMLIGAFIASVAAAYAGRLRDDAEAKADLL